MQNGLALEPPRYELQPPNYGATENGNSVDSRSSSSSRRPRTEHTYELTGHGNTKKRPWIKLVLQSSAPSSNLLPMLWEVRTKSQTNLVLHYS